MIRNRRTFLLLIMALLTLIGFSIYGLVFRNREESWHYVTVVLDDTSSNRWLSLREGMNQAAEDNNIYLNLVSVSNLNSLDDQCTLISQEIESGSDGILALFGDSSDPQGLVSAIAAATPLALIENNVVSEQVLNRIFPDHKKMGETLANLILSDSEKQSLKSEDIKVGILAGNLQKDANEQRLSALTALLNEEKISISWIYSQVDLNARSGLSRLESADHPDYIISLDNNATETAADLLISWNEDIPLYGIGSSEKNIYYLERSVIDTLLVTNEYYMGYRAISLLADEINYHNQQSHTEEVEFYTVTSDIVHNEDIEVILFPAVR